MSSYVYFPSDGVTRLEANTPDGQSEPGPVLDEAIRQIKAYLMDSVAGPDAKISALLAQVTSLIVPPNNVPSGIILPYGKLAAPAGYLVANGQSVSRTTYASLFAAIGTSFGSVDGSSFNLPDCRGVALAGMDSAQTEFISLGTLSGSHTHKLLIGEIPSHNHTYPCTYLLPVHATATLMYAYYWSAGGTRTTGGTTSKPPAGGDQVHSNVQPVLTVNYIIKT